MSQVFGKPLVTGQPQLPVEPGVSARESMAFAMALYQQLSNPDRQSIRVRAPNGAFEISRGEAWRLLRHARRLVKLHQARERIRSRVAKGSTA